MTVNTTINKNTFTGDGVTTTFPFTFALQEASDVLVYVATVLQLSGYTVAPTGGSYPCVGGNIVFSVSPVNLAAGLIQRLVPLTQTTVLPVEGSISETTFTNMVDKLTMAVQQNNDAINRAIVAPVTSPAGTTYALPNPVAGALLMWNAAATSLDAVAPSSTLGYAWISNGVGKESSYQPITTAAGGNVAGPAVATAFSVPIFADVTGKLLLAGAPPVAVGNLLTDNGVGVAPTFQTPTPIFGGNGRTAGRQLPTSGMITGEYWHTGDWTSTGVITAIRARIHIVGAFTLNHALTINTELLGGAASAAVQYAAGAPGSGIGGGSGVFSYPAVENIMGAPGGGFGGNGGNGGSGSGSNRAPRGGRSYDIQNQLCGSGGGSGCTGTATASGAGGAGGGGLLIEATGAVVIGATGSITGTGGAGTNGGASTGGGGGGSGGGVDIRSASTVTLTLGSVISLVGGVGGAATGGTDAAGGGGGGGYCAIHGTAVTNNGTVTLTGGAAGAGGGFAATAGSIGVSLIENIVWATRTAA